MVYVKLLYCGLHRAEHAFQAQVLYLENPLNETRFTWWVGDLSVTMMSPELLTAATLLG